MKGATEDWVPFAVVECELKAPTQISLFGVCNFARLLTIPLDPAFNRQAQVRQALAEVHHRTRRYNGVVPFMGKPVAIIVNHEPGKSVRYDLEGGALGIERDRLAPESELMIGNRALPQGTGFRRG